MKPFVDEFWEMIEFVLLFFLVSIFNYSFILLFYVQIGSDSEISFTIILLFNSLVKLFEKESVYELRD